MNAILEIYTNKEWMVLPSFVHGILPTLMYNSNHHTMLGIDRTKKNPMAINANGDDIFREYEVTDDGQVLPTYDDWNGIDYLKELKQPFVNVIPIDGPITRNGGACSYGSKDIRDWLIKATDNPYCRGHVLVINTPGGSAWAKNDFQQGIEYAHSHGLRVLAHIDGLCASAGMYLASLCDEVYVMNLKDQLGCVGVMASFFTQKNGEKNEYTGETYREYYATKSINKNKEFRDIAEDDDATLLIQELDELEAEFRADMKASFPKADDSEGGHLDGKVFNAEDVMGILCDGQMMLGEVIARSFDLYNGAAQPIGRTANRKIKNNLSTQSNKTINMKEKFPVLFAALQVEEMQMSEDGAFLNMGLLETLNATIENQQKVLAEAKALAAQLTSEKAALESQLAEKTAEIETLNTEHASALEEKDSQISALEQEKTGLNEKIASQEQDITAREEAIGNLQNDLNGAKESLETAQNTIAERDQQITDLNAQVDELTQNAGQDPAGGAAPQNNGQGIEGATIGVTRYVFDKDLSYEENLKREKEWNEAHGK